MLARTEMTHFTHSLAHGPGQLRVTLRGTGRDRRVGGGDKNLRAGGPHGAAWHFNVEATLGVLLAPEGRVVEGLVPRLPVAHGLPDGLQDTGREAHCADAPGTSTAAAPVTGTRPSHSPPRRDAPGHGAGRGRGPVPLEL